MKNDIDKDYNYIRDSLYNLSDKQSEGIELMMELARESEHPRAFEVLSNMIKTNAEVVESLMSLQKEKRKIESTDNPKESASITNNNVFIGSSTDLQKLLHKRT
jgi:Terminase DNA packaging enzyme.